SSNFSDDLWIWNGSSWSAGTAFPSGVSGPLLVYNAGRNMMMVAGGVSISGVGERTIVADTYGFVNNSWVIIDRNSHPEKLSSAASAYNSSDKKIVMFGGNDGSGDTNVTWEFDGISWHRKTTATTPAVQSGHTMAFAAGSVNRTVLYTKDAKTYSYDGTNWTLRGSSALPGNREGARMVYDSYNNKIVLFGGGYYGSGSYYFAEGTYQYDYSSNTWTKVCGSGTACSTQPPDRNDFAMVFDAKRNVTVLYGGRGFLGDTWEWNGTSWTERTITDPEGDGNPANSMVSPEMAYHSESGSVLLFGGDLETDTFVIWKYDGTSYKLISSTRETLRKYHSSAYFADAGRMVFHGGLDVADNLAEGTLIYNVGKNLRPMQMFSVKTDSANIPEDARIEDVNVRFTGGAQGFSNNTVVSSISYDIFYGGAWISLGDIDYDVNNTVEYSFSVKDRRLIEGMRYGTRDQINLAFRPTVPAEGVWNDSRSVIQDVEMTVRYNLDGTVFTYPRYTSYYISSASATWQNARNDCISRGGDLLILNSSQEQSYVESLPGYVNTAYYWIGYHDIWYDLEWRSVSGTYVWQGTSTGSAQNDAYTNWYTGFPTTSSTSNCVLMNKSVYGGKWYNSTCTTARPYICELSRENSYMISTETKTWDNARTACLNSGADLVTIDGYNEQKTLETVASGRTSYYLGFTDRDVDGEWRWVSGSNRWNGTSAGSSYFYTNWYTSRPYSGTNYNHASFYANYSHKWNTPYYTSVLYYICEFDSPQFCSLNDEACINGDTCCSEVCDTDAGECVNCIAENYHGCDEKADCCDGNPCNTATDTCVNLLNTGESTCEEVGDCANVLDTCPGGKCCRANQVACSTTNDCCSTSDICYATTGKCCRFIGDYCTTVTNCCFGECVLSGFRKTCECRTYNTACTLGSQCCSGSCVSLKCAKAAAGKYCYSGTDCSSGTCFKNRCQ
ncbi:MAG TPA: C-type lectin domain-containing protein, partial [bacterium]|nr:C-type lectin domain-containing protein [bacterium]